MLEPTEENPITDEDRRMAKVLDLPEKTLWLARQPLPPGLIESLERSEREDG